LKVWCKALLYVDPMEAVQICHLCLDIAPKRNAERGGSQRQLATESAGIFGGGIRVQPGIKITLAGQHRYLSLHSVATRSWVDCKVCSQRLVESRKILPSTLHKISLRQGIPPGTAIRRVRERGIAAASAATRVWSPWIRTLRAPGTPQRFPVFALSRLSAHINSHVVNKMRWAAADVGRSAGAAVEPNVTFENCH